jgi:Zinc finger, C2H2 type
MTEVCTICGAPAATASELVVHMREAHKDANPASDVELNPEAHTMGFLCGMCGRRFPTPQALAAHNLRPHNVASPSPPLHAEPTVS